MKFGEHFVQRSVPAWKAYNIDYAALKSVVKQRTSIRPAQAIDIPGSSNNSGSAFERELISLIAGDVERVSKFVKSKKLEIESRLNGIDQQLEHVQNNHQHPSRNSTGLRRRFNLIAQKIQDVGEEISLLSRFVSANRTAVTKLVKKYVKWTQVESLPGKIQILMAQPESFSSIDLPPLMTRYEKQLTRIRYLYSKHEGSRPTSRRQIEAINSGSEQQPQDGQMFDYGKDTAISFDMAMDATQEAAVEHRATYWVHQDNILELRVLLVQHLRQLMPPEQVAQLIFDDLEAFGQRLTQSRPLPDLHAFISSGQAVMQVNDPSGPRQTARVDVSQLQDFVNDAQDWNRSDPSPMADEDHVARQMAAEAREAVHSWITSNNQCRLLAKACYQRTRFVELTEGLNTNTRVTLDQDIKMVGRPADTELKSQRSLLASPTDCQQFKHAILTVRYCDLDQSIIRVLNHSHLTERVDEFTIAAHTIFATFKDTDLPQPVWASRMEKDIRHVPVNESETASRKSSIFGTSPTRLGSRSSNSRLDGLSTPLTEPSTGANRSSVGKFVSKPKPRFDVPPQPYEQPRYWNEYEDGSEFGDDGYVIYVDPDAPAYPGQKQIEKLWGDLRGLFKPKPSRLDIDRADQTAALSADEQSPTYTSSSDTDSDSGDPLNKSQKHIFAGPQHRETQQAARRYSTFPTFQPNAISSEQARGQGFKTAVICMTSSLIIFILLFALEVSARRKLHAQVAWITFIGASISLLFGVIGLVKTLPPDLRRRHTWLRDEEMDAGEIRPMLSQHQADLPHRYQRIAAITWAKMVSVGTIFVIVCIGNGFLLASALQT